MYVVLNQLFQEYLENNGIRHISSPPYSPRSNGQAEVGVRVIKDLLKKSSDNDPFKTRLLKVLFYYRTVPHSVTQIPPCVLLNSRKYITAKDRLNPRVYDFSDASATRAISKYNVGDKVLALNLREGPRWLEATIVLVEGINV